MTTSRNQIFVLYSTCLLVVLQGTRHCSSFCLRTLMKSSKGNHSNVFEIINSKIGKWTFMRKIGNSSLGNATNTREIMKAMTLPVNKH